MNSIRFLRLILIFFGLAGMVFAFMVDIFAYGDKGDFGTGQFTLLVVGLIVFLMGLFGRKFLRIYKDTALVFLNIFVLIVFIELLAIIVGRLSFRNTQDEVLTKIKNLPYYSAQEWSDLYWNEAIEAQGVHYEPYVVWQHLPMQGNTVNFNDEGIRETPGATCLQESFKVFAFGGSTMLGWGAPDWGTIPAYLQAIIMNRIEGPICVINYGQDGYVSTQSLIKLMLQLQNGNIPDLVIFYDGINEVIAASESGFPDAHVTLSKIASLFDGRENPIVEMGKLTRIYALLISWIESKQNLKEMSIPNRLSQNDVEMDRLVLSEKMTDIYLGNYRIVEALSKEYNFEFYFFLQPHIILWRESLPNEEQVIGKQVDPGLSALAIAFYENVRSRGSDNSHLVYLGDLFVDQDVQIWIDDVGHITPEGNLMVAKEMIETMNLASFWCETERIEPLTN